MWEMNTPVDSKGEYGDRVMTELEESTPRGLELVVDTVNNEI